MKDCFIISWDVENAVDMTSPSLLHKSVDFNANEMEKAGTLFEELKQGTHGRVFDIRLMKVLRWASMS